MTTNHNQPDAAIDKTLAALNSAAPPAGMEDRIAARLAQQPAPAPSWRDLLTGYSLTSAWWHGAAAGAAVATLAVAAVLVLQHSTHHAKPVQAANPVSASVAAPLNVSASAGPCAPPAILRMHSPAVPILRVVSSSASHPVAVSPLTTQERALLRFAQTADPKAIAALNQENQARLEAQNTEQFEKFFTPPPAPPLPPQPQIDQPAPPNESANPQTDTAPGPTN